MTTRWGVRSSLAHPIHIEGFELVFPAIGLEDVHRPGEAAVQQVLLDVVIDLAEMIGRRDGEGGGRVLEKGLHGLWQTQVCTTPLSMMPKQELSRTG
jgi:hypothetical protein